jgi:hypothetical protein
VVDGPRNVVPHHGDPAAHQIRSGRRQTIVAIFRRAIQYFDVPPLDIALFIEALDEIGGSNKKTVIY